MLCKCDPVQHPYRRRTLGYESRMGGGSSRSKKECSMRIKLLFILAIALTSPAWGAGYGHGNAAGNHGSDVSQAAHNAKTNGDPVGPAVRDVARSKSQG